MTSTWAIILAAGKGIRTGLSTPKQFLPFRGRPLYWHSALALSRCVDGMVFVFNEEFCERERERIGTLAFLDNLAIPLRVTSGGSRRQDSCRNGIGEIPANCGKVLVHDGARPFLCPSLAIRVRDALGPSSPCVVPAIPPTDTVKQTCEGNPRLVERTLVRERLMACQTPQGFMADILKNMPMDLDVTDEATLAEKMGYPVTLVEGDGDNIKITSGRDLKLLVQGENLIPCSGFGYDVHKFGGERDFILGGIRIPTSLTIAAHSDGDVLLHALMDALLGMASLGDIGRHFPDDDPQYEGASSAMLLDHVMDLLVSANTIVTHVDLTVVAQKPKLAPFADQITRNVAGLLNLDKARVNFKATTEEKLGFTGECRGIKAYALVTGQMLLPSS